MKSMTEFCLSTHKHPAQAHVLCQVLQRRQTNQHSPVHPHPSHFLSIPLYCSCLLREGTCSAVLHAETTTSCSLLPSTRSNRAERSCYIIQPRGKLDGCFSIMLKSLFVCGVLGVLLIPVQSELISVCVEDDNDLRVDCRIEPRPNKIASYEFSWSSGTKETLINTNVSGSSAEMQFKDKSEVVELEPGYRMTLSGFTDTLPHNTTYMCKISGQVESVTVEKEHLAPCSAVSMFLKTSWSWIGCLLLFLYYSHC